MADFIVRRLDSDGDLAGGFGLNNFATGAGAVAQKVRTRLHLFRGEWFLDPDVGVPWLPLPDLVDRSILGTFPIDEGYAERQVLECILSTSGVDSVTDFVLTIDKSARTAYLQVSGRTTDGDTWNIEETF